MPKIVFNETNLNRLIIPNLSSSMSNLRTAIQIIKSLNIPYNFKYRRYLKSLDENLSNDLNSINKIYNIIKDDVVNINRICNQVNSNTNFIDNISVSPRQSPFK